MAPRAKLPVAVLARAKRLVEEQPRTAKATARASATPAPKPTGVKGKIVQKLGRLHPMD